MIGRSGPGTVYEYTRPGFEFRVYENRIEVRERKLLGWKRNTILVKSITDIELLGVAKATLWIKTIDRKEHRYQLGRHAEEARAALVELM